MKSQRLLYVSRSTALSVLSALSFLLLTSQTVFGQQETKPVRDVPRKGNMPFRKLWWGTGAKSDSGFSVRFKGLHDVIYREGDKVLVAFREMLTGDPSVDIDSSSIEAWLPPHENEVITPEKRRQILDNICTALDFLKVTYVVR